MRRNFHLKIRVTRTRKLSRRSPAVRALQAPSGRLWSFESRISDVVALRCTWAARRRGEQPGFSAFATFLKLQRRKCKGEGVRVARGHFAPWYVAFSQDFDDVFCLRIDMPLPLQRFTASKWQTFSLLRAWRTGHRSDPASMSMSFQSAAAWFWISRAGSSF